MILISPFPRPMRNKQRNPKEYPWWDELLPLLPQPIVQIGVKGEAELVDDCRFGLSLADVKELVVECDLWIAVDNFLQHMAHQIPKPGVVLWGKSDPNIFGYQENLNLLSSRTHLRERQFDIWETEKYDASVFVPARIVLMRIKKRWPNLVVVNA